MPLLNLREAAELVGSSKSSVFRAVKAGRVSAQRTPEGEIRLDPAELTRAFSRENVPLKGRRASHLVPGERGLGWNGGQGGTQEGADPRHDLERRNAALMAKVEGLVVAVGKTTLGSAASAD
jgi:hypothetical protein